MNARRMQMHGLPVLEKHMMGEAHDDVLAEEAAPKLATVCVVGLGYVGLPVAVEFGKQRPTVGFDLATKKVERLRQFHDATGEVSGDELRNARMLAVTS
ncbi:MAG: hypothetical protein ACXWBQ_01620, partial [Usitatibacter sp.]